MMGPNNFIRKLVTLYAFVITSFMAITGILSATNYIELVTAILFSPLAFYFSVLMLPRKQRALTPDPILDIIPDKISEGLRHIKNPDYDPERRKFLKLI